MIKTGRENRRKRKKATKQPNPQLKTSCVACLLLCESGRETITQKNVIDINSGEQSNTNHSQHRHWKFTVPACARSCRPFRAAISASFGGFPQAVSAKSTLPLLSTTGVGWLSPAYSFRVFLSLWRSTGFSTGWFLFILDNPLWPLPGAWPFRTTVVLQNWKVLDILRDLDTEVLLNPPLVTVKRCKFLCAGDCFWLCFYTARTMGFRCGARPVGTPVIQITY